MTIIVVWLIAATLSLISNPDDDFVRIGIPIIFVFGIIQIIKIYHVRNVEYLLFFSISIASFFGFAETLTGSHAESSNVYLYGLSFYTASIAYLSRVKNLKTEHIWSVSNPLLLTTGPIALYFNSILHHKFIVRLRYYFPFIIIGAFMFQIVASPLTEFFYLINETDLVSALVFASIFEIFVYMNFCGLSLIVYGTVGLLGYRIPLNFKQPFSSSNVVEFWRGWHVSLSQVLKVLFYVPLRSKYPAYLSLLAVYLASAMWHGITVNFFLWGTFHALSFWVTILLLKSDHKWTCLLVMPFAIVIGRLIFADSKTDRLLEKLLFRFDDFESLASLGNVQWHSLISLMMGLSIVAIEFAFRRTRVMRKRNYKYLRSPAVLCLLCGIGVLLSNNVGLDYAVYGQR